MCNHYQNHPEAIPTWQDYIGTDAGPRFSETRIDIWPKYQAPIVRVDQGAKILDSMQWGVPLTMKGKRRGTTVTKRITNVRNLSSPFWRSMLIHPGDRSLVPFTRFAEPRPGAGREECWFMVKEAPLSAFAGIWRASDEGNVFAFLTCEPNPLVRPVHPKAMPVILQPDDYDRWLAGDDAEALAVPFPSQLMAMADA